MNSAPNRPFRIPAVSDPERYVGLYVYDFKTHASIGYTALEIRLLRESDAYGGGTAYEIYRATDGGGFELRGALDDRLTAREAICFLRRSRQAARKDYEMLRQAAQDNPLPCPAELRLAEVSTFALPHVAALVYPVGASHTLAGWLNRCAFEGGERVVGGIDALAELQASPESQINICDLPTLINYGDRSAEEVLRTVHRPVQR